MNALKSALLALAFLPSAGFAQGCAENTDYGIRVVENGREYTAPHLLNYTAHIAERDLFNSRGVRLRNIGAVLQQDRANYHKSGFGDGSGGFSDGDDGYFVNLERRSALSTATYYADCYLSAAEVRAFKADIVNGRVQGVVWVIPFQRPGGGMGVYISLVN